MRQNALSFAVICRFLRQSSFVPLELPAPPMMLFAIGIEDALDVPVKRPHDTDARKHRRSADRRNQDQGFHRRLLIGFPIHVFLEFFMKG
jgi:hypothetical protein